MILVTGGTGFLGSFLLRSLVDSGQHVCAIRRASSSLELVKDIEAKVDWVDADILDVPSLEAAFNVTGRKAPSSRLPIGIPSMGEQNKKQETRNKKPVVYHCAAVVSHRRKDVKQMMRVNVEGTANIVNLCLAHDVKKLVHVSSIAALGRTEREQTLDETSNWEKSRYNSPYGLSKFRSEREVWRGIGEGLDAVMVNPSVILGPGQWERGTGRMFSIVDSGLRFYPASTTGFVDVRDVVHCMTRLMDGEQTGERFIINAENRSMKDVFGMIANAIDKKPPKFKAGPAVVRAALSYEWLRTLTGKYPRYTRALARNSQSTYEYDNSKVRGTLGFSFRDLEETIEWVAKEYGISR